MAKKKQSIWRATALLLGCATFWMVLNIITFKSIFLANFLGTTLLGAAFIMGVHNSVWQKGITDKAIEIYVTMLCFPYILLRKLARGLEQW